MLHLPSPSGTFQSSSRIRIRKSFHSSYRASSSSMHTRSSGEQKETGACGSRRSGSLFPLDVAAEARLLVRRNGPALQEAIEGRAQIAPGDRNSVSRSGTVKLAAVDEAQVAVEDEEIRRACRAVRPGHLLRGVKQVGEREPFLFRPFFHLFRRVFGILLRVVGI